MKTRPPKRFETAEQAIRQTRRIARQLARSQDPLAQQQGLRLEACLAGETPSCRSGACPRCARESRRELLREIAPYMKRASERHMLTLVLPEFSTPVGKLHTLDMSSMKRRFERVLRDNLPTNMSLIGAIDISLNSFNNRNYFWSPHAHLMALKLGAGLSLQECKKALRLKLPTEGTLRPLKVTKVKSRRQRSAVTYCYKSRFEWRSGYLKTKNLKKRAPHRASRGLKLKPRAEVELRQWLSRWTMPNRLILVGIANPAALNSIKLRDTTRTPKQSEKDTCPARGRSRVTRSGQAKKRSPCRRVKRGAR